MKIIISPAKSIAIQELQAKITPTEGLFLNEAEYLVNKLKSFSSKEIEKMMSVSKDIANLNHDRFQNWKRPVEPSENVQPAIAMFTGEVYRGLDAKGMQPETMNYLRDNLRILSGLYGLLKPSDLMFPYRLEMGTKWNVTPKTKNLYYYWGTKIADSLNKEMESNEDLINLASSEYFKAVDMKKLKARIITPVFKELKNGEYKVVMTYAKNARGKMVRFIAENKLTSSEEIKAFDWDKYRFHESLSTDKEWVFTR
ncbi:MAG: cytoplasmic iron level regulating protein YaaA (DUF328/UPF0246 family) [Lentimonas sp.]|jgi:cytoplasmic iron level regulating protein YaaA (DUF328/UPF0246 family)